MGDLDDDGVVDIAVGAPFDDDGGAGSDANRGAVWILYLNSDGTVKAYTKISGTEGGFTGALHDGDEFGVSLAPLGDLDGDGVGDLVVGADSDDDGGNNRGAAWILLLNDDETVKAHQKISSTEGGFTGALDDGDHFGISVAGPGDLDGDSTPDLAVGALWDGDGALFTGAVWVLFLNPDGTVKGHQKISSTEGGFTGRLDPGDAFSWAMEALGDQNGDGVPDLAVGARWDDDGGDRRGAAWIMFLDSGCPADLDDDGVVDTVDFLALLSAWGPCAEPCPPSCAADLNGDCAVDTTDFLELLANWGPCG